MSDACGSAFQILCDTCRVTWAEVHQRCSAFMVTANIVATGSRSPTLLALVVFILLLAEAKVEWLECDFRADRHDDAAAILEMLMLAVRSGQPPSHKILNAITCFDALLRTAKPSSRAAALIGAQLLSSVTDARHDFTNSLKCLYIDELGFKKLDAMGSAGGGRWEELISIAEQEFVERKTRWLAADGVLLADTTLVLTALGVGFYEVTVSGGGETATSSFDLTYFAARPLTVTAIVHNSSGFDVKDGSVKLYISDGVPPYAVKWSHGATTTKIVVKAGEYDAVITDFSGAAVEAEFFITQPVAFKIDDDPLEVTLMADGAGRDAYCKTATAKSLVAAAEGWGEWKAQRGYGENAQEVCSFVAERDGAAGKAVLNAFSAGNVSHTVLKIDSRRSVDVHGDTTIMGETSTVTVPSFELNQNVMMISELDPITEAADGCGVSYGAQRDHSLKFAWDCMGWDVKGDAHADALLLGTAKMSPGNFYVRKFGCSVTLDDSGLTLEGARVVDEVPTTTHYLNDDGATHVASGVYLGENEMGWFTTNGGFRAASFTCGDVSVGPSGLALRGASATAAGVTVGDVDVTATGLNLGATAALMFGSEWRLSHNVDEDCLQIEKLITGIYEPKFTSLAKYADGLFVANEKNVAFNERRLYTEWRKLRDFDDDEDTWTIPNPDAKFGLLAGTYRLSVSDATGAFAQHVFTISQSPPLLISVESVTPCSRHGGADGGASISAQGGIAPYIYSWSFGEQTGPILRAPAGSFVGSVQDSVGAAGAVTVLIEQPTGYENDLFPPDVSLMANVALRDRFCRELHCNAASLTDSAGAQLDLMTRGDEGTYEPLCTLVASEFPEESTFGRVSAWCKGDDGEFVESVRVEFDGVTFFGDLNCTGGVTRFDVEVVNCQARDVFLQTDIETDEECEGGGISAASGTSVLFAEDKWRVAGNLHLLNGVLRVSDADYIGVDSFAVSNGSCGVGFNNSGLSLRVAKLLDRIATGQYECTDDGFSRIERPPVGPAYQAVGVDEWSVVDGTWHVTTGLTGGTFETSTCSLAPTRFSVGNLTLSNSGLVTGQVQLGVDGVDLGDGGSILFADGSEVPDAVVLLFDFVDAELYPRCMCVSQAWRSEVLRRSPELAGLQTLYKAQRETLHLLNSKKVFNVVHAVNRSCALCKQHFMGSVNDRFGVYAHLRCIKMRLTHVEHRFCAPVRAFLINHIPSERVQVGGIYHHCVWREAHNAIPRELTLEGFLETHAAELATISKAYDQQAAADREERMAARRRQLETARASDVAFNAQFKDACIAASAPFTTTGKLRKMLGAHPFRIISVSRPREMVRRALFALEHARDIPCGLRAFVLEECDITSVQHVKAFAHRIHGSLWRFAFRSESNPALWVDMAQLNDKDVFLIEDADKKGFEASRVLRAAQAVPPSFEREKVLSFQLRGSTTTEDFEQRAKALRALPLHVDAVGRILRWSHDIVATFASYKRALRCAGADAFVEFGHKCFTLRGDEADDLATLRS
ncbi:hypothetical protein JKP88DRAFT_290125 [Tribonema minus]|uniref:Uncharacterized protein n=1 Tax=Tribonema minus TaxID=303371 RepID=A0A835Z004_9STRA|nr:hypothetical protein JKP88DRAFT_290125 [Tribonema minus]